VGGASRNERRRRQEAAAARKPAIDRVPGSGHKDNRAKVGIIVAVVVVAVIATTFVLLNRPWGSTVQPVAAAYPVAVDGVVVTAGQPGAPVTVDVYEIKIKDRILQTGVLGPSPDPNIEKMRPGASAAGKKKLAPLLIVDTRGKEI